MPDWRGYVRERLPQRSCPPEREAEIVEEVAQQLQDIYAVALRAGATSAEAEARVVEEIHDWRALASDLQLAERPVLTAARAVAVHRLEPAMHRFRVGLRLLEILRDARLSLRALKARPLFTLTTVMTFALGIGATTVVFSLVHSVLLSPLPYREPDRLALVQQVIPEIADRVPILGVNPRSFTSWEKACRATCGQMAALVASRSTLTGVGEPEGLMGATISPALFDVLGIPPMLGRSFTREEDAPGRNGVAIITYGFWQRRLGADPAVIGRVLALDGVPVEIVGSFRRRSACRSWRSCQPARSSSPPPSRRLAHSSAPSYRRGAPLASIPAIRSRHPRSRPRRATGGSQSGPGWSAVKWR